MAITSAEKLAERAVKLMLIDEIEMHDIWSELGTRDVSLDELRKLLLRRDLLTFYQIEHLLKEDRASFYYGEYKVLYLVGKGTFARVYRAAHRDTGAQVAVKVLRRKYSEIPEEAERFCREGRMAEMLKHPNIVPIYEVYSKDRKHYLVIEFVEGQNLREFVKVRKVFEPMQATKLILDVANGLDYAFGQGISHRDLKMSNVLISSRGQAKLADFGLAGVDPDVYEKGEETTNPRAIDYAGLERASGVHNGDERSDIFFVGCMYYHMLTGRPPLIETRDRILRLSTSRFRDIPPILEVNPSVPPQVALVVNKAIEFAPENRYQTPGELASALREIVTRFGGREWTGDESKENSQASGEGLREDGVPRILLLVENETKMQDALRQRLKRNGYRVLVTGDPERASQQFLEDPDKVDLAIFSTGSIGEPALHAFNQLGKMRSTEAVPAVLLLGENQTHWKSQALSASHRPVMNMPVTLRQLRKALVEIVSDSEERSAASSRR